MLIRPNPSKPLGPGNCRDYEIQESFMRRVIAAVSSFDERGTVPMNVATFLASMVGGAGDLVECENLVDVGEKEMKVESRKRKAGGSTEGHKDKIGSSSAKAGPCSSSSSINEPIDYSDQEPNYYTGSDSDLSEYNSEDDSDEDEEHDQEEDTATHVDLEIDMEKIGRDILDLARQAGNTESKEDIFARFDAFRMTKWQTKMWENGFRF
jgi:hypothetical protein